MRGVKIMLMGVMVSILACTLVIYNAMYITIPGGQLTAAQFWAPIGLIGLAFAVAGWGLTIEDK